MALTDHELFGIYPASFGDLFIQHVSNVDPQQGLQKMVITPAGQVDPAMVLEVNRNPVFSITAHDLAAILEKMSLKDGKFVTDTWKLQYQARKDGGTFQDNGHVTMSGVKGFLTLDKISAQQNQQQPVDVMLKFWALWDGNALDANNFPRPVRFQVGQSLSGVPGVANVYKLGPVMFEGAKLGGVQAANVTTGLGYKTEFANGENVPRTGTIDKRSPVFEVDVHNMSLIDSNGLGVKKAEIGMSVYFRNPKYADGTANHIKFTLAKCYYETVAAGTNGEGKPLTKLTATGVTTDSTVEALKVTTGVSIPS